MKKLALLTFAATALAAGTAIAATPRTRAAAAPSTHPARTAATARTTVAAVGQCLDACAAKRPSAADQRSFSTCMSGHFTQTAPRVRALRGKTAAVKDATWREVHATRAQYATRCAPAGMRAWTDCLRACSGR